MGIETVRDLVEHIPRAYLDWDEAASFGDLALGQEATVRCKLARIRVRPTRRRNLKVVEGVVVDAAGVEEKVVWFNQAHLAKLAPGTELLLHGTRDLKGFKVSRHELGGAGVHTLGLVPEYPATEALPSYRIRALVEAALPLARRMPDALPAELRARERLPLRADAIAAVHRPESPEDAEAARARLGLEELLLLQLGFVRRREALAQEARATALGEPGELLDRYRRALPFTLTPEQEEAIAQIDADLRESNGPCSGSSRATSGRGRRSSPSTRSCAPSSAASRARSWLRPRPLPSSTSSPWSRSAPTSESASRCRRAP